LFAISISWLFGAEGAFNASCALPIRYEHVSRLDSGFVPSGYIWKDNLLESLCRHILTFSRNVHVTKVLPRITAENRAMRRNTWARIQEPG
jgi:hypothetical protein